MRILLVIIFFGFLASGIILPRSDARAQVSYDTGEDTVFAHPDTLPFWISGQGNFIFQWHPRFHADYSGPHSFERASEQAASEVTTLYTALKLDQTTEAVFDLESAGGSGLSQAVGLAGYPNIDVVRNPELDATPYIARLWFRKVIPLSADTFSVERSALSTLTTLPVRRLDIHVGKFSMVDFFDQNAVASDSHMQFMNWTVVNNGAFDYAADTRGYTIGGVIDFEDRGWGLRFAEALVSKRANGLNLQKNLQDAHSENYELELRPVLLDQRTTTVRLLAFTNFANMGSYHQAVDQFLEGKTATPDIIAHPRQTKLKYGFGLSVDQEFTEYLRGFIRAGWNEGQHESFNYTEVNETVAFGGDVSGKFWNRAKDKFGVAFVGNGISAQHRRYLALGGLGFLLGDGRLSYGAEKLMECYYNFPIPLHSGIFGAIDLQYIDNPGYNRARGPAIVPGMRLHVEL